LFERFFRVDSFAEGRGNGLGATIMKTVVELHGGQVSATSKPGAGCEITFWLDCSQASSPARESQAPPFESVP
jgi:signal transduction histidine kinase